VLSRDVAEPGQVFAKIVGNNMVSNKREKKACFSN
jgi:hypothetical protein